MSDRLGMVQLAPRQNSWVGSNVFGGGARPYGDETAALIDADVARIIGECHEEARRLLQEHRGELDALVAAMMEQETRDEHDILKVTGLPPAPALDHRPLSAEDDGASALQ